MNSLCQWFMLNSKQLSQLGCLGSGLLPLLPSLVERSAESSEKKSLQRHRQTDSPPDLSRIFALWNMLGATDGRNLAEPSLSSQGLQPMNWEDPQPWRNGTCCSIFRKDLFLHSQSMVISTRHMCLFIHLHLDTYTYVFTYIHTYIIWYIRIWMCIVLTRTCNDWRMTQGPSHTEILEDRRMKRRVVLLEHSTEVQQIDGGSAQRWHKHSDRDSWCELSRVVWVN